MLAARASPDVSLDDDGVRLAQPKQLRGKQAYDLGVAAPRGVLVQEARAIAFLVRTLPRPRRGSHSAVDALRGAATVSLAVT